MQAIQPFHLIPEYRDYVWGSDRLRPGHAPTAEAWVVYAEDQIADGEFAGRRLGQLAQELGPALLGRRAVAQTGLRFPLLIKLLDCAAWLSLQVHPNDAQAVELEGPGFFGKTEAWHVVEAAANAEILCGLNAAFAPAALGMNAALESAVRGGQILPLLQRIPVQRGQTIFIPPGMLHALGPGLLIYEIQQTSDLTYRVWDWDRPLSAGRKLHIEQSLAVIDPQAVAHASPAPPVKQAAIQRLVACQYFELEKIEGRDCRFEADPQGESFHALTLLEGAARLESPAWQGSLSPFETILVPAACPRYTIIPAPYARLLRAQVAPEQF